MFSCLCHCVCVFPLFLSVGLFHFLNTVYNNIQSFRHTHFILFKLNRWIIEERQKKTIHVSKLAFDKQSDEISMVLLFIFIYMRKNERAVRACFKHLTHLILVDVLIVYSTFPNALWVTGKYRLSQKLSEMTWNVCFFEALFGKIAI